MRYFSSSHWFTQKSVRGNSPKSIYYKEENANVVVVGTYIKFKIFSGKLLDVAPKAG
jgi:hypothetical protein